MMDYQITTAPAHEPVSLEQAKRHLRLDGNDSDALLRDYLRSARQWCELYSGRAFLWQTITAKRDDLRSPIHLPRPPLIAVSSVKYIDTAGTTQTVTASVYNVDTSSEPGEILLAYSQIWPSVRGHHHDVTITYIAGHAAQFTRSGSTLLVPGHRFNLNDPVQLYNIGGTLPAGLSEGTTYYMQQASGQAITVSLTEGGAVVAPSDDGKGTHYIDALPSHYASAILVRLTDLWTHRGDEDASPGKQLRELLSLGRMISL